MKITIDIKPGEIPETLENLKNYLLDNMIIYQGITKEEVQIMLTDYLKAKPE